MKGEDWSSICGGGALQGQAKAEQTEARSSGVHAEARRRGLELTVTFHQDRIGPILDKSGSTFWRLLRDQNFLWADAD